jgi:NET1-associated nuclear protein 1 (U3 small nucleolar RNA-associated protein 17)
MWWVFSERFSTTLLTFRLLVRWHHKSPSLLEAVVPHPLEDTFALFYSSTSPKPDHHQTQVSVYQVLSPNPHQTHSVPFKLLNIIWCPLSRSPSSLNSSSFTLVGITGTWSVVLVGDEVRLPQQSGSSPTVIVDDRSVQRRTLFQDIFGKSAFANVSVETPPLNIPLSEDGHQSRTGKGFSSIFDRPTYLSPPLESLFEPLVGKFLKKRTGPDVGVMDETTEPEHANIDEDVDMEDEADTSVAVRPQTARAVGEDEMAIFVDLFKKHIGNGMLSYHYILGYKVINHQS